MSTSRRYRPQRPEQLWINQKNSRTIPSSFWNVIHEFSRAQEDANREIIRVVIARLIYREEESEFDSPQFTSKEFDRFENVLRTLIIVPMTLECPPTLNPSLLFGTRVSERFQRNEALERTGPMAAICHPQPPGVSAVGLGSLELSREWLGRLNAFNRPANRP